MIQIQFGILDYIVIAVTLIASAALGLTFSFVGGKQRTKEEYLIADRSMPVLPVAVSLMVSVFALPFLIGTPAETFNSGAMILGLLVAYILSTWLATSMYLPVFHELQKISIYEYLELRFGPNIRTLTSLIYIVLTALYNGVIMYAPSRILETMTGLNHAITLLLVGFVCSVYSTVGGIKAVIWTQTLQAVIIFAAIISVVTATFLHGDSIEKIFENAYNDKRLDFSNFSLDPTERHTWWSLALGGFIIGLSAIAVNYSQIQRLMTVSTLEGAKTSVWISFPLLVLFKILLVLAGIGLFVVYKHCDPITAGHIKSKEELMTYFAVDSMLPIPGMVGLAIAGVYCAMMCSISAASHSVATVTVVDLVGRWYKLQPIHEVLLNKAVVCIYCLVFLGLAFLIAYAESVLTMALSIMGIAGGPMLGVFTLGMFTTYANEPGAIVSLVTSVILTTWMNFGSSRPPVPRLPTNITECFKNITYTPEVTFEISDYPYFSRLSYLWLGPIGFVCVLVLGSIVSFVWQNQQPWERAGDDEPDPALFIPPIAKTLRKERAMKVLAMKRRPTIVEGIGEVVSRKWSIAS